MAHLLKGSKYSSGWEEIKGEAFLLHAKLQRFSPGGAHRRLLIVKVTSRENKLYHCKKSSIFKKKEEIMGITRRDFLKLSAATGAGLAWGFFDLKPIVAHAQANPPVWANEAISICGYCSVGCSMIIGSQGGYVTYVQGNPDSPINKGSLCSKGSASAQLSTIVSNDTGTRIPNPQRLTKVKYRAPYGTGWVIMDYAAAIQTIAERVKSTRDSTFVDVGVSSPETGLTVNRCEGIASLGAATFANEACYMITKLMRAIGVVYLEHQARL